MEIKYVYLFSWCGYDYFEGRGKCFKKDYESKNNYIEISVSEFISNQSKWDDFKSH